MREDTERRDRPRVRRTSAHPYAGAESGTMLGLTAWARRTGTRVLESVRRHAIGAVGLDGMGWPQGPQAVGGQPPQQGSGDPLLLAGGSGGDGRFQLSLEALKALLTALPCW